MAVYTLSLELTGADKVQSTIQALNSLKSSGGAAGIIGGGSTGGNGFGRVISQLERGRQLTGAMKKDIQSAATAMAQGFGGRTMGFLANLSPAAQARVFASNPGLQAAFNAFMNPPAKPLPFRNYGMASLSAFKNFVVPGVNLPQFAAPYSGPTPPKLGAGMNYQQALSAIPLLGRYFTAIGAITAALEIMRKSVQTVSSAINRGFGIYSGAGQAGVSNQFYAQRGALSSIFGIQGNPNQVFMFGKAVTDVQQRIQQATRTLAQNAPQMAQLHINFDILKLDFEAFASNIATQLAPAISLTLGLMDTLIKKFRGLASVLGVIAVGSQVSAINSLMSLMGGKGNLQNVASFLKPAANLTPLMRQLPASSLEKMGLLIGGGVQNPVVEQIKKSNGYLKTIAQHISGQRPIPGSGQFGMKTTTNSP